MGDRGLEVLRSLTALQSLDIRCAWQSSCGRLSRGQNRQTCSWQPHLVRHDARQLAALAMRRTNTLCVPPARSDTGATNASMPAVGDLQRLECLNLSFTGVAQLALSECVNTRIASESTCGHVSLGRLALAGCVLDIACAAPVHASLGSGRGSMP